LKITKVDAFILRVPLGRKVADSFNATEHVGMPGVRIHTDTGLVGTGFTTTLGSGDDLIRGAIARALIERQGGRISVAVSDERGATFRIHLPRGEPAT